MYMQWEQKLGRNTFMYTCITHMYMYVTAVYVTACST